MANTKNKNDIGLNVLHSSRLLMSSAQKVKEEGGLEIIGAGFGRTGTTSLYEALNILGKTCYHMKEVMQERERASLWYKVKTQGDRVLLRELFKGYKATVDWPGAAFYKELMEEYPDAKVILSVRDPEKWYKSCCDTIYQAATLKPRYFVWLLLSLLKPISMFQKMVDAIVWSGTFNSRFTDKNYAIQVFNDHIDDVKKRVAEEKLLVFRVEQGWEPLCKFLDVPVPNVPFPHSNDTAQFQSMLTFIRRLNVIGNIMFLSGLAASAYFGYRYYSQNRL